MASDGAPERGRTWAARSIAEIGRIGTSRLLKRGPLRTGTTGAKTRACLHWHTWSQPPRLADTRQTGITKDSPPQRQDPVDLVGCSSLDGPVSAHPDRLNPSLALTAIDGRPSLARTRTPCLWRPHPTVTASPNAVFWKKEAGILLVPTNVAQRAAGHRSLRLTAFALTAALVVSVGAMANPQETNARALKVVVVVGPVGSKTSEYKSSGKYYASLARSYGASVTEIYSPYATWSKVKAAAQGANLLIYLGHGNGYPSPYGAFQRYTKDGMGLNASYGNGNSNVKYWGEYYIDRDIQMAKNAVVILNRLCYASGNSEWGSANPTKSTAIKRVDNYGAGFLRAGAKAVFAEAITSASYTIRALFKSSRTMNSIFMTHPSASGARDFYFNSVPNQRERAAHLRSAPRPASTGGPLIGNLALTATQWRAGG